MYFRYAHEDIMSALKLVSEQENLGGFSKWNPQRWLAISAWSEFENNSKFLGFQLAVVPRWRFQFKSANVSSLYLERDKPFGAFDGEYDVSIRF